MQEDTTQQTPPPTPQAVPPVAPVAPVSSVVVPSESPKKGPGLLWLVILLGVTILGGSAYFLYAQLQKPIEETSRTSPNLTTQQGKPDQGFVSATPVPTAVPTMTSSDSVADIDKDLSGTTVEAGNSTEFDADLQSLE